MLYLSVLCAGFPPNKNFQIKPCMCISAGGGGGGGGGNTQGSFKDLFCTYIVGSRLYHMSEFYLGDLASLPHMS